ncbi:cathepsin K isoform X4 [Xenopus tropicalis]|nr:cathepsin K isoform X4 [Xenopus tropicalis]
MGPSSICLVALLSLLIPAHSAPDPTLDTHWQLWVKTHQKSYKDGEEERARRTIWEETLKFITVHNLEYSLGLHTYEVGMNHLGDMTGEEVAATMTGYTDSGDSLDNVVHVPKEILEALPPASKDWRTKGCVTPVRSQGSCGSCYAFGAVGALECQWKRKTGRLVTFSPQELVDCSYTVGNNGCKGGGSNASFTYMKKYGVMEESAYPYTGKEAQCKKEKPSNVGVVKQFYRLPTGNEVLLKKAVGTVGPVYVAIDSSRQGFRMYKSGVYYDPYCSTTSLSHVVLIVGYSKENGQYYWLVKNSFRTHGVQSMGQHVPKGKWKLEEEGPCEEPERLNIWLNVRGV